MNKEVEIAKMAVKGCHRNPQAHSTEECLKCEFKESACDAYRMAETLYNESYRNLHNFVDNLKDAYPEGNRDSHMPMIGYNDFNYIVDETLEEYLNESYSN